MDSRHRRVTTMDDTLGWFSRVQAAIPDKELCWRISRAAELEPNILPRLFQDLADHFRPLDSSKAQQPLVAGQINPKKRKLEDSIVVAPNGRTPARITAPSRVFACKDVSFQIPARKKLRLELVQDAVDRRNQEVRLVNQTNGALEYALPEQQIEQAFAMAVPDKQARQVNFVLYPYAEASSAEGATVEPIVFSVNETLPSAEVVESNLDMVQEDDTYVSVVTRALNKMLTTDGKKIVKPTEAEFTSGVPQPHRKGEKAYHVRAHRGSKEGYLFFLSTGIFFGFKKPLAFFPFSSVESISYTSVLQRTFNLVITALEPGTTETKEVEFSMLDQADFTRIDDYVKRHGLNDASMATERRAQAYNVNKEKHADAGGSVGDSTQGQESELQKAEQALQDAEDAEEEDYEVSGGESDGEGENSDESEDATHEEEDANDQS